jgi:hypothetical protein
MRLLKKSKMANKKINIRRNGPLAKRSGAITSTDVYERGEYTTDRSRAFTDALTRAVGAAPAVPTHLKEQGRWQN